MARSLVIDSEDVNLETGVTRPRAVVFFDYQNMYHSARDAFLWNSEGGHFGNFRPYSAGLMLANRLGCQLCEARIYTGVHIPSRNAKQHGAMLRRMSCWLLAQPSKVDVFPRPLAYRGKGAVEKGVDVWLAIDMVRLALEDAYDVAVLASADTDLEPAARFVLDHTEKRVVCVGYEGLEGSDAPKPLDLGHARSGRFYIRKDDFQRVADRTNYYESRSDQSQSVPQDQWMAVMTRLGRR